MFDRDEFLAGMGRLVATFDKRVSPELFDAYWTALQEIKDPEFAAAVHYLCRTAERFPRPKHIREIVYEARARDKRALRIREGGDDDETRCPICGVGPTLAPFERPDGSTYERYVLRHDREAHTQ